MVIFLLEKFGRKNLVGNFFRRKIFRRTNFAQRIVVGNVLKKKSQKICQNNFCLLSVGEHFLLESLFYKTLIGKFKKKKWPETIFEKKKLF